MRSKNRYSQIKSMSQLKREIAKLDSTITMKEALFDIQYSNFKESLKIGNLISLFISNFATIIPIITKVTHVFRDLYNTILALFRPQKQKSSDLEDQHQSQETENLSTK